MELQRLIIEDFEETLTLEVHPRLTVVFHEDARTRARVVEDLVDALGPSRDGVHLELTLGSGQPLVLFRARSGSHRAIDPGRARDVTPAFRGANGSVDLLGRLGLPPPVARRTLRLSAGDVADDIATTSGSSSTGSSSTGSNSNGSSPNGSNPHGDPLLVQHLAGLDQRVLWDAAEQVLAAEDRLDAAVGHDPIGEPADRQVALDRAERLRLAMAAHRRVEVAARAHRAVLRLGAIVAGACALIAVLLLVFDGLLDDDGWTSRALFILAALALGVALWDRRPLLTARREERELLASLGVSSLDALQMAAGPLGEDATQRTLLAAAARYEPLAARWTLVSGGAPLEAALSHRAEVERRARRDQAPPPGAVAIEPAGTAELLRRRAAGLARVGSVGERLPLVLDDPFTGLDPADAVRLLETVAQLSRDHQLLLVSGAAEVLTWSLPRAAAGELALVRLDAASPARPGPSGPAASA